MNNVLKHDFKIRPDNYLINIFHKIDSIDLNPISETLQRPIPDGNGFDTKKAKIALNEYRRFLKLNAKYPDKRIVPNRLVDTVWHTHILDTRKYVLDCEQMFGYFLHHFPYFGQRGDSGLRDSAFNETMSLYRKEFGEASFNALTNSTIRVAAGCDAADINPAGCDAAD